jgi:hypothetical protein
MVIPNDQSTAAVIDERSALESAATVWAVLNAASELPATPEQREQLHGTGRRLRELLAQAGLTELDLRHWLQSKYAGGLNGRVPDGDGRRRPLRLLEHD